jgi:hypothetical protein
LSFDQPHVGEAFERQHKVEQISPIVQDESIFTQLYNAIFHPDKVEAKPKTIKEMAASDPNETRTIKEIVEAEGFEFEAYPITTDDGYILEVHRLF